MPCARAAERDGGRARAAERCGRARAALAAVLLATGAATAAAGCGGGVPLEELPSDPIAYVRQAAADGILGIEEFRSALRLENPDEKRTMRPRLRTRLSLLSPRTRAIHDVPDAGKGSLPMDWSSDGARLLVGRFNRATRRVDLHTWNRFTGGWDRPTREVALRGGSLGDGPVRAAWSGVGSGHALAILMRVDGQGTVPLLAGTNGIGPDISADGRHVVFVRPGRRPDDDGVIVLAGLADPEGRVLGRGRQPRFSRDGRFITFVRGRRGLSNIWLMRFDGTSRRRITDSDFADEYPSVSPDGQYVVYASTRASGDTEPSSQLYLTRVSDGEEIQLTDGGQNSRPVW